jgi:hypothetical protein
MDDQLKEKHQIEVHRSLLTFPDVFELEKKMNQNI